MSNFNPVWSLLGGVLIGASMAVLLVLNGRIAGVSGVLGGLVRPARSEIGWRVAFLGALLVAPLFYRAFGGTLPTMSLTPSIGLLILAGLVVGFGTRLGAGCTSGHGVCGIGRGSPRSLAATAVFMGTAVITVFTMRHILGI